MGLPKQRKRKSGNVTTEEIAIRKLQLYLQRQIKRARSPRSRKEPEQLEYYMENLKLLLDYRKNAKTCEFLDVKAHDPDGAIRCEYKFTTETGRLASAKNPLGTGTNLQNIDRSVKDTFLPWQGHVLLNIDLSQAESRVVFVLSGNKRLIELAHTKPWEFDAHSHNASVIFKIREQDVTYDQRQQGKIATHGAQRGMRGKKMAENLLKAGFVFTKDECDEMADSYLQEYPGLNDYFGAIRRQVLAKKELINSWERLWNVQHEAFCDDLYRRGYSFLPQSEVVDLLNQMGLKPAWKLKQTNTDVHMILIAQVHDSIVFSLPPDEAYDVAKLLHETLETPRRMVNGIELSIPCTFSLGNTWKGNIEFKRLPKRKEFRDAAYSLL